MCFFTRLASSVGHEAAAHLAEGMLRGVPLTKPFRFLPFYLQKGVVPYYKRPSLGSTPCSVPQGGVSSRVSGNRGSSGGAACRGPPRLSFESRAVRRSRAGTTGRGAVGEALTGGQHLWEAAPAGQDLPSHPPSPSISPPLPGAKRRWDAQGLVGGMW